MLKYSLFSLRKEVIQPCILANIYVCASLNDESYLSFSLRKEVIQPHLPIRLPCYDFTPVANLALGCSIPCGFGHRLWALPTPVV